MTRSIPRLVPLLLSLACAGLAVLAFTHGGQDDTYITYWAAHALSDLHGIVNYNGAHIEQSSSLGLVLVLGFARLITRLPVPLLGYVVSLGAFAASLLLAERLLRNAGAKSSWLGVLVVGTIPAYAYWATSGMETSLVVATGLWTIERLARPHVPGAKAAWGSWLLDALALLLFACARPETPILAVGLLVARELHRKVASPGPASDAVERLTPPLAALLLLLVFRRLYFGGLLPNPARIKRHGFAFRGGFKYLQDNLTLGGLVALVGGTIVLAFVTVAFLERARRFASPAPEPASAPNASSAPSLELTLLATLATGYLGFIVASGGDWMRGGRFVALVAPFGALALALLCAGRRRWELGVPALIVLANFFGFYRFLDSGAPEGRPLWTAAAAVNKARTKIHGPYLGFELANKVHARDALLAEQLTPLVARVHALLGRPVTLMSGQAGLVAYETFQEDFGNARFLDQWNITDPALLKCLGPGSFDFSIYGTKHDLGVVLDGLAARGEGCGLGGLPDIYFNERLRPPHQAALAKHDYVVVYQQQGEVRNTSDDGLFQSKGVADGHIAVRADIAHALGLKRARAWKWDLNP